MQRIQLQINNNKNNVDFSITQWIVIIGISLLFAISPYKTALFNSPGYQYERTLFLAMVLSFSLLSISFMYLMKRWRINNTKSILSIAVFLIPTFYLVSSIQAVSVHSANIMTLINFMLAAFFIFGLYFSDTSAAHKAFPVILSLSGYTVLVFGLLNMFGQTYYPLAIWFTSGEYRLASVFQYSNTYAGFLSALLFVSLYWVISCKRWYWISLHAFMLVPILISLFLTLSRGALVVLPLLVLIFLLFFEMKQQILSLTYLFISAVTTLAILNRITEIYNQIALMVQPQAGKPVSVISIWDPVAFNGWLILFIGSLMACILIYSINRWGAPWLEKRVQRIELKKSSFIWIPAFSVGFGILLILLFTIGSSFKDILPNSIADRLENINFKQHSVLERLSFYKDAMKVLSDYPLLGTGGGGWSAIYEQYQNNPYISSQAHSYFVQTLVEIGWIGFFVFMTFIIAVYFLYIRFHFKERDLRGHHFVFFIFSLSLLIHSLIDFDMSFIYLNILVFFCLGAMLAPYTEKMNIIRWAQLKDSKTRFIYPSVLTLLALLLLIGSMREYNAVGAYGHAMHLAEVEKKGLDEAEIPLTKAIDITPANPGFTLTRIGWYTQAYLQSGDKSYINAIEQMISRLETYESYNRNLILAKYRNFKDLGKTNESIAALEEGIQKFQWDIKFYEAAMMEYAVIGQQNEFTNPNLANQYWNRGLELYQEVITRMDQLKELPEEQLQGRDFDVNPFIRQAVGSIYYFKHDFSNAISILTPVKQMDLRDDPYVRIGIRYYLASLDAIGQKDDILQNLLIAVDPHEKMLLEDIYSRNIIKKKL